MNRRTVLSVCASTSLIGSGCLSRDGDDGSSIGDDGRSESPADRERSHTTHILQVSIDGSVPDDIQPVDAKEAGLTENEYIATVLEKASDEYTDGMEDELGENGSEILASISDDTELDGVAEKIESGALFVEYEGVTYLLIETKMSLEVE